MPHQTHQASHGTHGAHGHAPSRHEPPPAVTAGTKLEWTCPMHPEIVRNAPGNCPICGMALEPRTVTLEVVEDVHLKDMTRRFWVSVVLSLPLVVTAMAEMIWGAAVRHAVDERVFAWGQFALATPVVLWGGWPFFERAWVSFPDAAAQHVQPDRAGRRGRVSLQRVRGARAGRAARRVQGARARSALLRGGGGHHDPRAAWRGARTAGALADLERGARAARPRAQHRDPGRAGRHGARGAARRGEVRASGSACGPGRRSRSTAWCSRDIRSSTSR